MIEQLENEDKNNRGAGAGADGDGKTQRESQDGATDLRSMQAELQHHRDSIREEMDKRHQDTQQQLDEIKGTMRLILSAITSCGTALPDQFTTLSGHANDETSVSRDLNAAAAPPQRHVGEGVRRKHRNGPLEDNGMAAALCFPADCFLSAARAPTGP